MKNIIMLVAIAVYCLTASPSFADLYQWYDADGAEHFSDTPPPNGIQKKKLKKRPEDIATTRTPESVPSPPQRLGSRSLFAYRDDKGIIHLTNNYDFARKGYTSLPLESFLTRREIDTIKFTMNSSSSQPVDTPVENLDKLKKQVNQFARALAREAGDPGEPLDQRLSTPEKTWLLFRHGLKQGKIAELKSTMTPECLEKNAFEVLPKQIWQEMDKQFSGQCRFDVVDEFRAKIHCEREEVTLINPFGNWKIDSL